MKQLSKFACVGFAVVALVGCGDGAKTVDTTVNPSSAGDAVGSMTQLKTAMAGGSAEEVLAALGGLSGSAMAVIEPETETDSQSFGLKSMGSPRALSGTCTCNAAGCTFSNCTGTEDMDGLAVTVTLNGSINLSGSTLTFDLDYTGSLDLEGISMDMDFSYSGSITATDSAVDGDLALSGNMSYSGEGQSASVSYDVNMSFNNVGLDASGCAESGSMSASVDFRGSSSSEGAVQFAADATVTFNGCGQATAS